MARPKMTNEDEQARQKMVDVFWDLLEKEPYSKITVRQIAGLAGVNHNTFYYHFKNIEDMAMQLVNETVCLDAFKQLMNTNSSFGLAFAALKLPNDIKERHLKMYLLLRNGDSRLTEQFKKKAVDLWLESVGRTKESLSEVEQFELNFIIGGIVNAVGKTEFELNPKMANKLYKTDVFQTSVKTLKQLAAQ